MDRERRVREYLMPEHWFLDMWNTKAERYVKEFDEDGNEVRHFIRVPKIDMIPDGATVLRVGNDFCSQSMTALVSHPSFDVVPDGCKPPVVNAWDTHLRVVQIEVHEVNDATHTQEEDSVHGAGVGG